MMLQLMEIKPENIFNKESLLLLKLCGFEFTVLDSVQTALPSLHKSLFKSIDLNNGKSKIYLDGYYIKVNDNSTIINLKKLDIKYSYKSDTIKLKTIKVMDLPNERINPIDFNTIKVYSPSPSFYLYNFNGKTFSEMIHTIYKNDIRDNKIKYVL